ncbi:hypothetical protein J437_LFUL006052 [Ladona fulva]|uniref:Uncharacterized protein n=1 Tax=Ladona fulva TaxID=123851 RepID=A0A8K0K125_LADFU|nr:hypothetical protein J437_LFUL006052 [Ladona fulva]
MNRLIGLRGGQACCHATIALFSTPPCTSVNRLKPGTKRVNVPEGIRIEETKRNRELLGLLFRFFRLPGFRISHLANHSVSVLTYTPKAEDDGKDLTCRAENMKFSGGFVEDRTRLKVFCKYYDGNH